MFRVNRHTLGNGLRIVHNQDTSTAMVALNVLYDTGARDESPTLTGIAHLFEHLMFAGSANIDSFDGELTAAGGESNAWTSNDFTNFYEVAPAHNAETLFHLESDRMLQPALGTENLEIQKQVVTEEFKQQCLNRPYGDQGHQLRKMVYGEHHPYSWPVIGKNFEQIANVGRDDAQRWFAEHYAPSNAVLAVTGNISFEETVRLAEKWFGPIPARTVAKRQIALAPPVAPGTEVTMFGNVPATSITVAFLMDSYGTTGYYAADAITDILSAGNASRFFRRLIVDGDGTFTEADASILGSEHQGMLMLTARLADEDTDPARAAQMLIDQARTIVTEPPTEHDLQRLKNKQRANAVLGSIDYLSRGQRMAMAEMHHEGINDALNAYLALTVDDLVAEGKRLFFNTNPAILIYRPNEYKQQ